MSKTRPTPVSRAQIETLILLHAFGGQPRTAQQITAHLSLHPALEDAVSDALLDLTLQGLLRADEANRFDTTPQGDRALKSALKAIS